MIIEQRITIFNCPNKFKAEFVVVDSLVEVVVVVGWVVVVVTLSIEILRGRIYSRVNHWNVSITVLLDAQFGMLQ